MPLTSGGLQLEWHQGGIDLEISVRPSGEAYVLFEDLRDGTEWEGLAAERRLELSAALRGLVDDP